MSENATVKPAASVTNLIKINSQFKQSLGEGAVRSELTAQKFPAPTWRRRGSNTFL